jgi:hypothetical protein
VNPVANYDRHVVPVDAADVGILAITLLAVVSGHEIGQEFKDGLEDVIIRLKQQLNESELESMNNA